MPCYCSTPNSADQAEIQRRCKERMYFDATDILTADNLKKAEEMGLEIKQFPYSDPNTALCNICKVLTAEQMESISACHYQIEWAHKNLLGWYEQHCKDDEENKNEK